ncbi:MAG: diguanylate cyclase [Candidatus Omnitrophica bacterium]|nr:diguanylate cyclase [Candidatus Omnitrophota bacterium]
MLKSWKLQVLSISVILSLVYTFYLAPLNLARAANLKILDIFISLGSKFRPMPAISKDIILVTIDDESLREINIQWPWPRSLIAQIIKKLSSESPSLICADLVFAGKSVDREEDADLIKALKDAGNVFAAGYFGNDGIYVMPDEPIAMSLKEFGFVNKPRDTDNTIRLMRPFMVSESGGIIDYSLSLKVASNILNTGPARLALAMPLSKDGTAHINFFGEENRFTSIPVWKIIKGGTDIPSLKKRIVFLGVTSELFHDVYNTPLGIMPGLLIDLNETLTYADKSFFHYAAKNLNFIILFFFILIAAWGGLRLPILSGMISSALLIASFLFLGFAFFLKNIIIDAFGPVFLTLVTTIILHGSRYVVIAVENMVLGKEAVTDGLTGLYLYRYFELQLKRELKNAFYSRKNLALVIYDIDHFKRINDTYGHEFGNIILKSIARNLLAHSRKDNIIARYGGEEFCIIVPGMKRDDAIKYAERLRNLVSFLEFKTDKGEIAKVTMSAGIVTIVDAASENTTDFIKAADSALYKSKAAGRDRITVYDKYS